MPARTWDVNQVQILDTDLMDQGVCIGTLASPSGTVASKSFPSLTGCTVLALSSIGGGYAGDSSVTYPGGVPTVTIAPSTGVPQFVTMWAFGTRTMPPSSGITAVTPSGQIALGPETFGLHFVGRATFNRFIASSGNQESGALGWTEYFFDSAQAPAVVAQLIPGQYVSVLSVTAHPSTPNRWVIWVQAFAEPSGFNWGALTAPVVCCYTRVTSQPGDSKFVIYDANQNEAWDLCRPNLLYPVRLVAVGRNTPVAMPGGMTLGICGSPRGFQVVVQYDPFEEIPTPVDVKHYSAYWTLDGSNNLRAKLMLSVHPEPTFDDVSQSEDPEGHAIVVNISNY